MNSKAYERRCVCAILREEKEGFSSIQLFCLSQTVSVAAAEFSQFGCGLYGACMTYGQLMAPSYGKKGEEEEEEQS